jgi:hypothetical protein
MPEMNLSVSGGPSYFQVAGQEKDNVQLIGNFSFSLKAARTTSIGVRYNRRYRIALGFGRNLLTDYASANISQSIKSRLLLGAIAGYTRGEDPLMPGSHLSGERYRAFLSFQITRGLRAGASYQIWITEQQFAEQPQRVRSEAWAFSLSYATTWY